MSSGKVEMLESYIRAGMSPILMEEVSNDIFKNAVILEADCEESILTGHYEDTKYVAPAWYYELLEKSKNNYALLVVNELNKISLEEQLKFVELFKYKKVSTFKLPENTIIIATAENLEKNPITKEIYTLIVHI